MDEPRVEKLAIPAEYGNPTKRLAWSVVEQKLAAATVYWIASTRPDGRPHVIPRDGMWIEGKLYYGGSPETVHYRNIVRNPEVVAHIGDGQEAIIVEGAIEIEMPTKEMATRLSDESFVKYPQYGRLDPSMYMGGVSTLLPRRVLAWTNLTEDATRFVFD
ncbi:MAG TPA: pyridoxamine 5'-phosphate oxidase family protein [Acidimicrobiia bacterium]|nr:pyridoxamine 5'-phosphate oxidase family protein [Acidimicrobiia bacterium]